MYDEGVRSEAVAQDLEEQVRVVCGHLNACHVKLVELAAEAIATDSWSGIGVRSIEHWLTWQTGISARTARMVVRLVAAKDTHPTTSGVFAEGRLSLEQAALAVTAPAHCDAVMADLAPRSTIHQLGVEVRAASTPPPVSPDQIPPAPPTESVSWWCDDSGRWHLHGELDPDRGRIVDAALREAGDRLLRDAGSRASRADTLVNIAERSLDHHDQPVGRRDRFRINVFIDPTTDLPATWQDGYPLPDTLREWLWCDGSLTPTFVEQGRPVAVGPTIRGIPDRIRRLVLARDRKCRVPWCQSTIGLQVHHIIHRENGGPTELWNLMAACPRDHRLHHLGGFDVNGDANEPDGLTFTDPRGRVD